MSLKALPDTDICNFHFAIQGWHIMSILGFPITSGTVIQRFKRRQFYVFHCQMPCNKASTYVAYAGFAMDVAFSEVGSLH